MSKMSDLAIRKRNMEIDRKDLIAKMQKEQVTICEYCGAQKEGLSFMIGASNYPEWTMVEGTGKMACPICYERAMMDSKAVIDKMTKGG